MTIKEMLETKTGNINLYLPLPLISFLKSKAFHDSEDSGKRVTQVSLVKDAIINQYKDEIKKYLKDK